MQKYYTYGYLKAPLIIISGFLYYAFVGSVFSAFRCAGFPLAQLRNGIFSMRLSFVSKCSPPPPHIDYQFAQWFDRIFQIVVPIVCRKREGCLQFSNAILCINESNMFLFRLPNSTTEEFVLSCFGSENEYRNFSVRLVVGLY